MDLAARLAAHASDHSSKCQGRSMASALGRAHIYLHLVYGVGQTVILKTAQIRPLVFAPSVSHKTIATTIIVFVKYRNIESLRRANRMLLNINIRLTCLHEKYFFFSWSFVAI